MTAVLGAGFGVLGGLFPAPPTNYDSIVLLDALRGARDAPARWLLAADLLGALTDGTLPRPELRARVAAINGVFAGVGIAGMAVAAFAIARTRDEAFALAAFVVGALGTLQVAVGYVDVYPIALAFFGVYVGLGALVVRSEGSLLPCGVLMGSRRSSTSASGCSPLRCRCSCGRWRGGNAECARWRSLRSRASSLQGWRPGRSYGAPFAWTSFLADANSNTPVRSADGQPAAAARVSVQRDAT